MGIVRNDCRRWPHVSAKNNPLESNSAPTGRYARAIRSCPCTCGRTGLALAARVLDLREVHAWVPSCSPDRRQGAVLSKIQSSCRTVAISSPNYTLHPRRASCIRIPARTCRTRNLSLHGRFAIPHSSCNTAGGFGKNDLRKDVGQRPRPCCIGDLGRCYRYS